jgi:hypothetical protein
VESSSYLPYRFKELCRATTYRPLIRAAVAAAVISLTVPGTSHAQSLELGGKLLEALNEAHDAFESLTTLHQAAQDALSGRSVSAGSDWSTLADRYDHAAQTARSAPLPSDFQSKNIVSVSDFMDCSKRTDSMDKLRGYLGDLQTARDQGNVSLSNLDQRLTEIPPAQKALTYLINVHQQLVSIPVYGQKFAFDWLDLEARVSPALNSLEAELKNQRARIAADVQKLNSEITNYQANLSQLTNVGCSSEAGLDDLMLGTWNQRSRFDVTGGTRAIAGVLILDRKIGEKTYSGTRNLTATHQLTAGYSWLPENLARGAPRGSTTWIESASTTVTATVTDTEVILSYPAAPWEKSGLTVKYQRNGRSFYSDASTFTKQ